MSITRYTLVLFALSFFSFAQANVWIPALFVEQNSYSFLSVATFFFCFMLEFFFIKWLVPSARFSKVLGVAACMNLGSTVVGFLGGIVFYFMAWYMQSAIEITLGFSAPNIPVSPWLIFLYAIMFFVSMIILNVMIEGVIAILFFPMINRTLLLKLLFLSNFLAMGLSIGIMSYRIAKGQLPEYKKQRVFEKMEQEDIKIR